MSKCIIVVLAVLLLLLLLFICLFVCLFLSVIAWDGGSSDKLNSLVMISCSWTDSRPVASETFAQRWKQTFREFLFQAFRAFLARETALDRTPVSVFARSSGTG